MLLKGNIATAQLHSRLYLSLFINILHGPNASTNTKGSRNPETKEDLHNGYYVGFNRSISRGRQLCRRLTAPDRNQRQCIYTSSLVAIQSLRSAPTRMGLCRNVRQKGSNPKRSRQLDEHWSKDHYHR